MVFLLMFTLMGRECLLCNETQEPAAAGHGCCKPQPSDHCQTTTPGEQDHSGCSHHVSSLENYDKSGVHSPEVAKPLLTAASAPSLSSLDETLVKARPGDSRVFAAHSPPFYLLNSVLII
jgi:hypothetical protein